MDGLTRIEPDGLIVTARAVPDPDAEGRPAIELEVSYPDPDVNQRLHHVCLCWLPGRLAQHPAYGDHLTAQVCHEYHGRGYFRVSLDLPYLGWLPELLDRVLAAVRQELTVYARQPLGMPPGPDQQRALDRAGAQLADLLRPLGFEFIGPTAGRSAFTPARSARGRCTKAGTRQVRVGPGRSYATRRARGTAGRPRSKKIVRPLNKPQGVASQRAEREESLALYVEVGDDGADLPEKL